MIVRLIALEYSFYNGFWHLWCCLCRLFVWVFTLNFVFNSSPWSLLRIYFLTFKKADERTSLTTVLHGSCSSLGIIDIVPLSTFNVATISSLLSIRLLRRDPDSSVHLVCIFNSDTKLLPCLWDCIILDSCRPACTAFLRIIYLTSWRCSRCSQA